MEILHRNVDRLANLVGEVLDVARLEANRLRLAVGPLDLNDVIEEVVETFRATAAESRVGLEWKRIEPLIVSADSARLAQVLFNLLSNAFKFTSGGGMVRVTAEVNDKRATVHVRDTGAGLREQDFHKLFRPFSQVHDTMKHVAGGSGLGLYISQGIVERHGGRIWADSGGESQGSTFSFDLPLIDEPAVDAVDEEDPLKGPPSMRKECTRCRSADIVLRVIKNKYECNACKHTWRRL